MKSFETTLLAGLTVLVLCCQPRHKSDKVEALREFQNQVDTMLPEVASLTGVLKHEPVAAELLTKEELGTFLEKNMKIEYADAELKKRGRCFAAIGLLPEGYDLEQGFMTLLKQQAGAVYDLRSKILIGVSDLPSEQRRSVNDKMILSHELTHALQDRVMDIARESGIALKNIDYEYALRAVLEGMASSVMIAYAQNLPYNKLPDLQRFWRSQLSQVPGGRLGGSPRYLTEYLMSPYAEGGAFVQSWQRKNPDRMLSDLLQKIPASSEQVLHFEKYAEGDTPAAIDLSRAHKILPAHWKLSYANILGEFDLLVLFQVHEETQRNAAALAAGWGGCAFEAYEIEDGALVLLGASVWDAEKDAEEFCEGFSTVLEQSRPADDYEVVRRGTHAGFVIGSSNSALRTEILRVLVGEG